mmetsp:Transcript_7560/g.18610  ORF Transcript_7560/g.18610 Transcript_7560/m.18610 type:complete len:245 (+) Transcript_7560:2197-2931(+)
MDRSRRGGAHDVVVEIRVEPNDFNFAQRGVRRFDFRELIQRIFDALRHYATLPDAGQKPLQNEKQTVKNAQPVEQIEDGFRITLPRGFYLLLSQKLRRCRGKLKNFDLEQVRGLQAERARRVILLVEALRVFDRLLAKRHQPVHQIGIRLQIAPCAPLLARRGAVDSHVGAAVDALWQRVTVDPGGERGEEVVHDDSSLLVRERTGFRYRRIRRRFGGIAAARVHPRIHELEGGERRFERKRPG